VRRRSKPLIVVGTAVAAAFSLACGDTYTGPFRDPNAPNIPSFADSAFGPATKWFAGRTFDSVTAAGIDAASAYVVELTGTTRTFVSLNLTNGALRWAKTIGSARDVVSTGATAAAIGDSVSAFDAASGAVRFSYRPTAARIVTSNGATDGTYIYVGNANGEIVALNPTTGAEAWKLQVDTRTDSMSVLGVAVSGGIVYGGGNGFLAALNATTGAQVWKKITSDNPRPLTSFAPAVDSGRVTVGTKIAKKGLINYVAGTGAVSWSINNGAGSADVNFLGAACAGHVFVESAGELSALADGGAAAWGRGLNAFNSITAMCGNGTVITNVLSGGPAAPRNDVMVLNAANGAVIATYPIATTQTIRIHRVLRNATALYVLTAKGVTAVTAP